MTVRWLGIALQAAGREQILGGMLALPPHPEVPAGLLRLRDAGLRLATLTNSRPKVAQAQPQGISMLLLTR
jgi:2-haloacid dehalogenase